MLRTTITFTLLALIATMGILGGNARAAWVEDFESYADGYLASAPWDEGTPGPDQGVISDAGFTGKGLVGNGLSHIWCATDPGAYVLTARLYSEPGVDFSRYYVGFHTEPSQASGFPDNDSVIIYLSSHADGAFMSFESYNYDAGVFVSASSEWTGQAGILDDTWYDVRMTVNTDDTVSGEYKLTTSEDWIPIGDGVVDVLDPANFAPNYVGVAGQNSGRIDDISVTDSVPGDADRNGTVDAADAAILAANWQTVGGMGWGDGDFNGDNNVDDIDATMLATNWTASATGASVPEPTAAVLLCGVLAALLAYRRSSK